MHSSSVGHSLYEDGVFFFGTSFFPRACRFFPLSFHWPVRSPVSRLPADHLPVVATGVRVGVRVTRRNRQHVNGWNIRVRGTHDSVYQEIVDLGHFLAIGALYFDLAAKMVVTRKRFGPDHAEMMFAIRAHKRIVAWHWRTPASWIEMQVGEAGTAVYFFLSHKSMKSLTVSAPPFGTIKPYC